MCNPRRITITTAQVLSQAWSRVFTGAFEGVGEAHGLATLTLPYGNGMPPALRALFAQRLGRDSGWRLRGGRYEADLADGTISYDPDTGELELTVRLSAEVAESVTGSFEVSGTVEGGVNRDFTGQARTDAAARVQAERAAASAVAAEQQRLDEAARRAAEAVDEEVGARRAEAQARAQGRQRLEESIASRAAELDTEATALLEERRDMFLLLVNRVYAGAVQDALENFARRRGARNLQSSEDEGVIELSFEIEA